jgi:hypothetical protein
MWRGQIAFDPTVNQTLMFAGFPANAQTPSSSDTTSLQWSWNGLSAWSNLVSGTAIPRFGVGAYSGVDKGILYFSPGIPLGFNPDGTAAFTGTPTPSLWLGHGQSWQNISTSDIPKGLNAPFSMLSDSKNNQVLLMGATNIGSQLWSWNGASWSKVWAATGPGSEWIAPGRGGEVLRFDSAQTYSWTGFAWNRLNVPGPPLARGGSETLIYMPSTQDVVCVLTNSGDDVLSTYIYKGTTWTQVNGPTPSARLFPALGPTSDGNLILYGGVGPATHKGLSDTWTFDGKAWKQVSG